MDANKEQQIVDYVQQKEENNGFATIAETVADLAGVEKETKEGFLDRRLKNDKNLLSYAELVMKTEKLNIGETIKRKLLEVKLSVTCPYFVDFKDFLEELKRGPDISKPDTATNTSMVGNDNHLGNATEESEVGKHLFCGLNVTNIKSEPFDRNSKTGVTRCSKTARFNGYHFGVKLPSGDAYKAGKMPGKDSIQTIPTNKYNKTPKKSWKAITLSNFTSIEDGNYADIFTDSKSDYGHRASAFRDDSGQWYVLDPYVRVNGKLDNTPKKLEDYLEVKKIVKTHIYKSNGYHDSISEDV